MNPLRYGLSVRAPLEVPGVKLKVAGSGAPRNIRNLLRRPPPLMRVTPPWERNNLPIHPWVWDALTSYQREGLEFACSRPGANLWWEAGAGKTWAGIIWSLAGQFPEKVVVVTRANTKGQWKREFEKLTTLHPRILDGQSPEPVPKDTQVVILNWEILPHWVNQLREWQEGAFLAVVYDEIHRAKNWRRREKFLREDGTPDWRSLDNISASAAELSGRAKRRLGLTATPIANTIADLWSQLDLIEPTCWGTNWEFVHRYCAAKQGEHGGLDTSGRSHTRELKARLREVCHRVDYEQMKRAYEAKGLTKRRQVCYLQPSELSSPLGFQRALQQAARSGPSAVFETRLMEAASRKRRWVTEVVLEAVERDQKVTVFTGRRQECEALARSLAPKLEKLGAPLWWGHGEVSAAQREADVRAYSKFDRGCAFIGTIDAFGEAVDGFQHTDRAIFAMIPWTPKQIIQAEGRFSRLGQTRPVLLMYPIAEGTVDEHVADVLLDKLGAVSEVTDHEQAGELAGVLAGEQNEDDIIAKLLERLNNDE